MYLSTLSLVNFKNYSQIELKFSESINCFAGNNGVGKTNLLDAIYYLSMCKSFFNNTDTQNIKHKLNFFVIQGEYKRQDRAEHIYCGIKRGNKKKFRRNDLDYKRLSEHIGLLPIVMVSPADNNLILGGSEERRKYIDSVISQYDKEYIVSLIRYNRVMQQRNTLLKDFAQKGSFDYEMIELWNAQLIPLGKDIHAKRTDFLNKLLPVFQEYYDFVSEQNETVELKYQSQLNDTEFESLLKNNIEKDKILQYTTVGVHKDDLQFRIGDYALKKNGSQGQQKTFLIALKFAQFDFISKVNPAKPILLLDDIFDKFDANRVTQLIKLVSGENFGQIFITDTSTERLHKILDNTVDSYKLFTITKEGIV